ncbi:hypothetical protein L2E65_12535 [Planktothrix agardhii 1801]|jgi:hypothetical protein|uniref:hypothetical protein n=1 Tax=Planktothrix agardhii TaxID=1160 RepID=UPI0037846CD8|nr:hypothetical protein [Planktothrix agardhii 1801]
MSSSWSNFKTNNNLIVAQSEIPYISEVEGVAILGVNSTITIKGFNFNPASEVICNAGIISNIRRNPEQIIFDCLASSPGTFLVEVRNGTLSSLDWNSSFAPILIARNGLNLTIGWLDFRTADSSNFGLVVSHINQGLATKTFVNSGYLLNTEKGLTIGATGASNNATNYIQFNNYIFPLNSTIASFIVIYDTTIISGVYPHRARVGVGKTNENTNKMIVGFEAYSNVIGIIREYLFPTPSPIQLAPTNTIIINSSYIFKIVFNFFKKTLDIFKLDDLLNFDSNNNPVIIDFPIFLPTMETSTIGIPLFVFFSPNSISSVVAMKID